MECVYLKSFGLLQPDHFTAKKLKNMDFTIALLLTAIILIVPFLICIDLVDYCKSLL